MRGADVGLRARRDERMGEDSREDRAEFVVEGGAEMLGTAEDSFGSWARVDACVRDLNAERGSSTMSLSLADRRDVNEVASSSSWATPGPSEEPLG